MPGLLSVLKYKKPPMSPVQALATRLVGTPGIFTPKPTTRAPKNPARVAMALHRAKFAKFSSMRDELNKIAARGFRKVPGERVKVRPGLIEIQKVGGPLSLLKRIGRGFKRMGRRKPKGAPGRALQVIPASPVVKGRTSSPRASKGKGLVLPAAMIGTGLAIGGTALGASKIIEKSMEPHRRVQPPYSGGY